MASNAPAEVWHPRAQRVIPTDGHTGLSFIGVPPKGVIHTTEARGLYRPDTSSYFSNPYWPNATIDTSGIYQHIPIDAGGYALEHRSGWVETNRANVIQCEVMWQAADPDWPDALLANLADWVGWVSAQLGIPLQFAEMYRDGVVLASTDSPIRFGEQEWLDASLWCGHTNVPGQEHWDPGRLPVDRLHALLSPPVDPPDPPTPPARKKAPSMFLFNYKNAIWICAGGGSVAALSNMVQVNLLLEAGVPTIGDVSDEFFAQITGK